MSVQFDHEELRVYQAAIGFVAWLEDVTADLADKVSACDHLARASAGVPVNIAEASGKRSMKERRQFVDTAYGSALECAACLDVLTVLKLLRASIVHEGKGQLSALVSMMIGYRKSTRCEVREEGEEYDAAYRPSDRVWFDHEKLDVYRKALELVEWCGRLRIGENVPRSTVTTLDKAATGVVLNVAEGNGKFSVKDRCRFINHARTAALQSAATLDVLAVRRVKCKPTAAEGKSQLANIVRMLVAWEQNLEER